MRKEMRPEDWELGTGPRGELLVGECSTVELARLYGTPLHVVHRSRLEKTARSFCETFRAVYPGRSSAHYAFKCNSVPGVIDVIRGAGLRAEIMSEFELKLALHLGYRGEEIIVNGPCKTDKFLRESLRADVRFIVVDSLEEMTSLNCICLEEGIRARILFRINPDVTPQGMNQGAATGSRKGCAFGLDLKGGEAEAGFGLLRKFKAVDFFGFHFHIGTGIQNPGDYSKEIQRLAPLFKLASATGYPVQILDVGGGFPSQTSRELTTRELLIYQGFERLPSGMDRRMQKDLREYAETITDAILRYFAADTLPELILEPGRSIVSSSQFLLLTVHRVKDRPGIRKWLITDGGLGTVTLPTFYEYHEMFLCNDIRRPRTERVTIVGPVCFAADVVYRNKIMPEVKPGEILALMDSGAYFTALESSFGFARPAIVSVEKGRHSLLRRAEAFGDMVCRDLSGGRFLEKEEKNEICSGQKRHGSFARQNCRGSRPEMHRNGA